MTPAPWWLCLACGAWQAPTTGCRACRSGRVQPAGVSGPVQGAALASDRSAIRVLLDVEARPAGEVCAARIHTDRLSSVRGDTALLAELDEAVRAILPGRVGEPAAWDDLHAAAGAQVQAAVERLLRPRWPGQSAPSTVPVVLSLRLLHLDPSTRPLPAAQAWLEVVDWEAAVAQLAGGLRAADLTVELYGTVLHLGEGGDRLRLGLRAPVEAQITSLSLCTRGEPPVRLAVLGASTFLPREQTTHLVDTRVPASVLWRLAQAGDGSSQRAMVQATVLGMEGPPVCVDLPCGDLGQGDARVDVFLDLGDRVARSLIAVGGRPALPQEWPAACVAEAWGLPPCPRSALLDDPTGAVWANWGAALLPALRRFVAREHRGYLRRLHLALPQTGRLDVAALSQALAAPPSSLGALAPHLDPVALGALFNSAAQHVASEEVDRSPIVVVPALAAVARHLLAALQGLHAAAQEGLQAWRRQDEERARQRARQATWDQQQAEQRDFERQPLLWRWTHSPRRGPSGPRPPDLAPLPPPADWMVALGEHADWLDRVVVLDAGGGRLDWAVLEGGGQGRQRVAMGGALAVGGADPAAIPGDEAVEVDRGGRLPKRLALAQEIAERWRPADHPRCTVLLRGVQGARSTVQVGEAFAAAGLTALVYDARRLSAQLQAAGAALPNCAALQAASVRCFEQVEAWGAQPEGAPDPTASDPFAVVGGLLAGALEP